MQEHPTLAIERVQVIAGLECMVQRQHIQPTARSQWLERSAKFEKTSEITAPERAQVVEQIDVAQLWLQPGFRIRDLPCYRGNRR